MKRITCSLCGGTGVAYEIQEPVQIQVPKQVAALERQSQLGPSPTLEEEEAWEALEKTLQSSARS